MYKYLQSYLITILIAMLIELTTFILSCREGAISNSKSRTCLKYIIYFRLSIKHLFLWQHILFPMNLHKKKLIFWAILVTFLSNIAKSDQKMSKIVN